MKIDLNNFEMGPGWTQSEPGTKLPPKKTGKKNNRTAPPKDGAVRVGRETKGRKGAGVSVITGLPLNDQELKQLAKQLKQKCGTGGTVKSGVIEIQGDHRDLLVSELQKLGYAAKRSGG